MMTINWSIAENLVPTKWGVVKDDASQDGHELHRQLLFEQKHMDNVVNFPIKAESCRIGRTALPINPACKVLHGITVLKADVL